MAKWEPKTVKEVVVGIETDEFVLPVIQRRLVWTEEKMELLFDSILKGNSYGGIMVLREDPGHEPLFAYRRFSREGEEQSSAPQSSLPRVTYLVIDGQQRLQALYMGLKGGFNGKRLYFNILSRPSDYEFSFAIGLDKLPKSEPDDNGDLQPKKWVLVPDLLKRLQMVHKAKPVADEFIGSLNIDGEAEKDLVRSNVQDFSDAIMTFDTVGISMVWVDRTRADEEKQRVVELFRRLNDGGTRLSSYDLVASVFKGYDYRMEQFFVDARQFHDIHFYQDELIKLIFLLQDDHRKDITQVTAEDADFAISNQDRIFKSLEATRAFLKNAGLYNYYASRGRSAIPLYFIAYHIYHQPDATTALPGRFDNFDTGNQDFTRIRRWLALSLLNGVFSRGSGWIPTRTGVRKILLVMQRFKGQLFPTNSLFTMYRQHPLRFSEDLNQERLPTWNRGFVFYLIYDQEHDAARDVDHIHPRYLLNDLYEQDLINAITNYQLLDPGTNRNDKRAKSLADWIERGVVDRPSYLRRHLIPGDPALWDEANFPAFTEARSALILKKIDHAVPGPIPQSEAEKNDRQPSVSDVFDTPPVNNQEALVAELLGDDEIINEILRRLVIPPGQLDLYRLFFKNPDEFFSMQQIADAVRGGNLEGQQGVFMAFGRRIGASPDPRVRSLKPSNRLFFDRKRTGGKTYLRLRPRVIEIFKSHPKFYDYLINSPRSWLPDEFGSDHWENSNEVYQRQMAYFGFDRDRN